MKRFEFKKYEQHGEGIVTDMIKTAGKKAATTIGEHAGKKAGDKIIELLKKRKSGTESASQTGGLIKRKRGRPRKITFI